MLRLYCEEQERGNSGCPLSFSEAECTDFPMVPGSAHMTSELWPVIPGELRARVVPVRPVHRLFA
jgi:hypothetical protein